MATIRQLKSGRWNVQIRNKELKVSKTFDTELEARRFAAGNQPEDSLSFADVCDRYIELKGENIRHRVAGLRRSFKSAPTLYEIEQYRARRLKQVKSSTVRLDLQMLSRIFKFAIEQLELDWKSPFQNYKYPNAGRARDRIVTPLELKQLIADLPPLVASACELSYETAMRRGEIVNIQRQHIEFNRRRLYVPFAKNGYDRYVPLNDRAMTILKERLLVIGHQNTRLYPVESASLSKALRRSCARLDIKGLSFHCLRHTAITKYARRGMSVAQLKVISGHRSTEMLERYTHLGVEDVVGLMN